MKRYWHKKTKANFVVSEVIEQRVEIIIKNRAGLLDRKSARTHGLLIKSLVLYPLFLCDFHVKDGGKKWLTLLLTWLKQLSKIRAVFFSLSQKQCKHWTLCWRRSDLITKTIVVPRFDLEMVVMLRLLFVRSDSDRPPIRLLPLLASRRPRLFTYSVSTQVDSALLYENRQLYLLLFSKNGSVFSVCRSLLRRRLQLTRQLLCQWRPPPSRPRRGWAGCRSGRRFPSERITLYLRPRRPPNLLACSLTREKTHQSVEVEHGYYYFSTSETLDYYYLLLESRPSAHNSFDFVGASRDSLHEERERGVCALLMTRRIGT